MQISKLCFSIPSLGMVKTATMSCSVSALFKTVAELGCGVHQYYPYGCLIDENRNKAAREALAVGASHLMFVDADMIFPDDGILALASRNKRIIGANYNLRDGSGRCTVKISDREGRLIETNSFPQYPFKCYAVATGFMLIQVDVFRELPRPWFFYEYDHQLDDTVGEDVYFCKKARAKGIDVWCDPTIEVKHIGDFQY